jgi:type IX secretion system PorP/SprF family membrane protein
MKGRYLIIIILVISSFEIKAQISGIHNFYTQNLFYFSSAHTGDKNRLAAFMDYRNHLSSLDNSLESGSFGIHSPVSSKMNLGGIIRTERIGLFETLSARLDYAYRTNISTDGILALGINGGVIQKNLNIENAIVFDTGDPTLTPDYSESYNWFAGASVNYQFKNFNVDFAVPAIYKSGGVIFKNFLTYLSYTINTKSEKWVFQPSLSFNYYDKKQLVYHINLMTDYDNIFWFQPTWKSNNSFVVSAGVNLRKIGIGYAYETNSSALSAIGGPSHEIFLSYGFFKTKILPGDTAGVGAYQSHLKRKIGDKTYEEYINSNNYSFYGSLISLSDSMHREEVKRDSLKTVARMDSIQKILNDSLFIVRQDSLEIARQDSVRKRTLRHLSAEDLIILEKGVHFELGSAVINTEYRKYLNEVAQLIINNKQIKVLISGHTCDLGTEEANLRFSVDRSEAVKYYLIQQGVDPDRVSTDVKLDAIPVAPNTNEENRKLNRRVSFSIIKE